MIVCLARDGQDGVAGVLAPNVKGFPDDAACFGNADGGGLRGSDENGDGLRDDIGREPRRVWSWVYRVPYMSTASDGEEKRENGLAEEGLWMKEFMSTDLGGGRGRCALWALFPVSP